MLESCFGSNFNYLPDVVRGEKIQRNLRLADLTLREGEQASNAAFSVEDRLTIARMLDEIGIKLIQGGHAIEDKNSLQVYKKSGIKADIEAVVLCFMPNWKQQIDAVYETDVDTVQIIVRSSDDHLAILGMTRDDMKNRLTQGLTYARKKGDKDVTCLLSFASKADYGYLKELYSAGIDAGASSICFTDSTGILKPSAVKYVVSDLKRLYDVPLRFHGHNDFGLATANALAAIEAGADTIDVSINGLGERAGHPPIDEVLMALRCQYGIDMGVKISKLSELAKTVARICNLQLSRSKPVVGIDSFSQKLDAHVLATTKVPQSIEPFDPHIVGNERRLVIGRYSGPIGVKEKARRLGISVPEDKIPEIIKKIYEDSIRLKRELTDDEFKTIVEHHRG